MVLPLQATSHYLNKWLDKKLTVLPEQKCWAISVQTTSPPV